MRTSLWVAILLCAAGPALAEPGCAEPPVPPPVDGATIAPDQLRAAVTAAKSFIAQSDVYQNCLLGELDAAKTERVGAVDPALERQTRLKVAANQKTKQKVGAEINTAIDVYKKTHVK